MFQCHHDFDCIHFDFNFNAYVVMWLYPVWFLFLQYQHAVAGSSQQQPLLPNERQMRKNESQRSFQAFGFGANQRGPSNDMPRRGSHINVNVQPTIIENETPEIRKYKKRFNSDILCASLWGQYTRTLSLFDALSAHALC